MQRNYRGKRADTKEWVYGYYYCFGNKHYIHVIEQFTGGASLSCIEVIPETVVQSTGLKDKNGKEIYERDIIKFEDTGEEGYEYKEGFDYMNFAVVCFNEGRYELEMFNDNNSFVLGEMDSQYELLATFKSSEIIGNTTDNPELLQEVDK